MFIKCEERPGPPSENNGPTIIISVDPVTGEAIVTVG